MVKMGTNLYILHILNKLRVYSYIQAILMQEETILFRKTWNYVILIKDEY